MQFNQFIWDNFKGTQKGKDLIEFFVNYNRVISISQCALYRSIKRNVSYDDMDWNPEKEDEICKAAYEDLCKTHNEFSLLCDELIQSLKSDGVNIEVKSFEEFEQLYESIIRWIDPSDDEEPERILDPAMIPIESDRLYYLWPEYCFPYFFDDSYYRIEAIFKEFGIFIPPVPKKTDMYGRSRHYLELCKSAYNFRMKFGMSEHDFPAFLYGFAVEVMKKYEVANTLPEPRKAYFVGSGKYHGEAGDFSYLDNVNDSSITRWQGNPVTQPGDIIVMYCLSPRSYIHSIWRAVTPGFLNPFFHFYKSIYAGNPVVIESLSLEEMKKDDVLKEMPLIKANMQGINGRVIEKNYYDRIIELLASKGVAIESLPQLTNDFVADVALKNEKDVELCLLEPLLIKLGYSEADWKRQFKLRMGRGDRVYPDYVIFPNEDRNNESGYWVWEAKFSIANSKQLEEDFGQAKSYALRLNCKGLCLISREGVWVSEAKENFDFSKVSYWSWEQIGDVDYFNQMFKTVGNKKTFN